MKVADVMSRGVDLVPPGATVQEAAIKMAEEDTGAVIVGTDGRLEGVLTDRDIILRAVVHGRDVATLTVGDLMSSTVYACREDDSVETAFHEMSERQVRRLPVLDAQDRLVGIVTLSDLGRLNRDPRCTSEALREMAEPHRRRASGSSAADDQ
jgi:CBS domain-containing protein